MCNPSPARIFRSVKRMTKFNERKMKQKQVLSTVILEETNIYPTSPKVLSTCILPSLSIPAKKKHLSRRTFQPIDIMPGASCDDNLLFTSYLDGSSHTTIFACDFCYDDHSFKSITAIRHHISTAHQSEMLNKLRTCYIPYPRIDVSSF